MEKKILGFILIALGLTGLLLAALSFINGNGDTDNLRKVIICFISGAIFLFGGINFTVPPVDIDTESKKDRLVPLRENG